MVPVRNSIVAQSRELQDLIANHRISATMATTVAPHSNGTTFFEPPLLGESLAARSKSGFIEVPSAARLLLEMKSNFAKSIGTPPGPCPKAKSLRDRHPPLTATVVQR